MNVTLTNGGRVVAVNGNKIAYNDVYTENAADSCIKIKISNILINLITSGVRYPPKNIHDDTYKILNCIHDIGLINETSSDRIIKHIQNQITTDIYLILIEYNMNYEPRYKLYDIIYSSVDTELHDYIESYIKIKK